MKTLRRVLLLLFTGAAVAGALALFGMLALPLDKPVTVLLMLLSGGLASALSWQELASWQLPEPEDPPSAAHTPPLSPVEKAMRTMDEAEDFNSRTERKVRIRIDAEQDDSDGHNLF